MVWKCPKCKQKHTSYSAMMKHFYRKHYTPKGTSVSKGKSKTVHVFRPLKRSK